MPQKGDLLLGESLTNVAVRVPTSWLEAVDAHIATLRQAMPYARIGRSEALRDILFHWVQTQQASGMTQPQPQEDAEKSVAAQSPVPDHDASYAPPGMQVCEKHGHYNLRCKECPTCGKARRARESAAKKRKTL